MENIKKCLHAVSWLSNSITKFPPISIQWQFFLEQNKYGNKSREDLDLAVLLNRTGMLL